MGGRGGDFILESGNDCDGQREKDREERRGERGRGDADEGGQQTKENRKKEKNVRRMKSNQPSNQASKDEKIRSNPKNGSQ